MATETKLVAKVVADTSGYKKGMAEAERSTEGFERAVNGARKATSKFEDTTKEQADTADKTSKQTKTAERQTRTWRDALVQLSPAFSSINGAWDEYNDKMDKSVQDSSKGFKLFKLAAIASLGAVGLKIAQVAFQFASQTAQMFDNTAYNRALEERQVGLKKFKTALGGFLAPVVNAINSGLGKVFKTLATVLEHLYAGIIAIYQFFKTLLKPVTDAIGKAIDGIKKAVDGLINSIKGAINSIAGLFGKGPVFKETTKSAEEAGDAIEKVGESAEYAEGGLQGFDKLNVADAITGDTKTVDDMTSMADAWGDSASKLAEGLGKTLSNIKGFFDGLSLEGIWNGIVTGAVQTWDKVKEYGGKAWDGIKGAGLTAWNGIKGAGETAWNGIKSVGTTAWNGILNVGTTVWNGITGVATTAWDTISSVGTTVWDGLTSFVSSAWEGVTGFFTGLWTSATETVRGIIDGVMAWFQLDWGDKWASIVDGFKGLWEGVTGWLRGVFDKLFGWIKGTIDSIMGSIRWVLDKVDSAKNAVKGAVSGVVGGIKGALGIGAASGDVIQPNDGLQYRVVGDNKRETEVISPLSTMKQAMKEALAESGAFAGGGSGPNEVVLKVDGKVLARATYDDFRAEGKRRGRGTIA